MKPQGFDWDEAKNRSNIEKHGIDFIDAVEIFRHPTLDRPDVRRTYGEPRTNSIGEMNGVVVVNVTRTDRQGTIRLISARLASRSERELYAAFKAKGE